MNGAIGVCVAIAAMCSQPTDDWGEVEWVDYVATTEFGMETVDGRVSGVEVRLFNNRRVDLIWKGYAIEADWSDKIFEGVGQSLYYAAVTHKKPGLLILVRDKQAALVRIEQALLIARRNNPEIRVWAYDVRARKMLRVSDDPMLD